MPKIILVDKQDRIIGCEEKMKVHELGLLHRAFSIFVFNTRGELLLQKRSLSKYHSGGLWSNTCCGHQRPGESLAQAVSKRLKAEMGFGCRLKELFSFSYSVKLDHGLAENELDHVFVGVSDRKPKINAGEISEYRYVSPEALASDIKLHPRLYTKWFKIIVKKYSNHIFQ